MADAFKLHEAIQAERDKMHSVIRMYEELDLDNFRELQVCNTKNMRAVRSWRLNIARNINAIDDRVKQQERMCEILTPQIKALNELLSTELLIKNERDFDEFYSLRSSILNSRRLLASLYTAKEKYLSTDFREELQDVLLEMRSLSKKVSERRREYKILTLKRSEEDTVLISEAEELASSLNAQLPFNENGRSMGAWSVNRRKERYVLRFDPSALVSWGNQVGTTLSGYLEDNTDLQKTEIIDYIVSHWGETFADEIYRSVASGTLSELGAYLANEYRMTTNYSKGISAIFEHEKKGAVDSIEPVRIVFSTRVSKMTVSDEENVPAEVKEELLSYARGKFDVTINAQNQINDYSRRYKTLPIELVQKDVKTLGSKIRGLKRHLRELYALVNSDVFGNQRNSDEGAIRIEDLNYSIKDLQSITTKTNDFRDVFYEFKRSCTAFEAWIDGSWIQFGGTPSGDVHSMGFSWAQAMGLTDD